MQLERRTVPGEDANLVERQVRDLVEAAAAVDPELRAEVRTSLVRPPFEIGTDAEIVRLVSSHAERVLGVAADEPTISASVPISNGGRTSVVRTSARSCGSTAAAASTRSRTCRSDQALSCTRQRSG